LAAARPSTNSVNNTNGQEGFDLDDSDNEDNEWQEIDENQLQGGGREDSRSNRGGVAGGLRGLMRSFFILARRPKTKEEWRQREDVLRQARRNRTAAIMAFFALYTFLMRVMNFDGYLLLLVVLEVFLFYISTYYKEIAIRMAKRGAENRVNRVKDWFYFGLTRHDERIDE
jgi:hypothetical protein